MTDTRTVPAGGVSDEERAISDLIQVAVSFKDYLCEHDVSPWLDCEQIDEKIDRARAALARWGAQTEDDAEKVEELLDFILDVPGPVKESDYRSLCRRAEAVRSSRRPKGRVVEGWARVLRDGTVYDAEAGKSWPGWWRNDELASIIPCRIEILDAPEEG